MSPSRYSRLVKPFSFAILAPYSTIFGELSIAMTCLAVRARSWESVPSPAPMSAITIGGIRRSSPWASACQERPGT